MPSSHVHDLLALLGRQAPPDVPRSERDSDGAESWSHDAILAQGLVVALAVALALALVLALSLLPPLSLSPSVGGDSLGRLRCRSGRRSRRLCGLCALAFALVLVLVLVVSLAFSLAFAFAFTAVGRLAREWAPRAAGGGGVAVVASPRVSAAGAGAGAGVGVGVGVGVGGAGSPASGPWVSVPALGFSTRRPCRNGGSLPGCRGRRQNPIDRPTRRPQGRADSSCPAVQC